MSSFISLTRLCSAASLTRTSHYSTLNFTYVELEINSFSLVQQKTSWIYLDIAAFQDFKVFLLFPHAFEDLATEKLKKLSDCKFEFRLNCKQRFTFHWGPIHVCISDNRFISVDAAWFCLMEKPNKVSVVCWIRAVADDKFDLRTLMWKWSVHRTHMSLVFDYI